MGSGLPQNVRRSTSPHSSTQRPFSAGRDAARCCIRTRVRCSGGTSGLLCASECVKRNAHASASRSAGGAAAASPLSPPKHRGSAASSRETSLDEETVEEALAAIAREEDEARKRRTKKSRKKGSGGKKSAAEKREAKVAAYLQKKVEAKNEIATDAKKKKKNRGVSWADEAPVTVPTTAVTGERIRMLHSARIHMTEAQRTRLAAVFGPDTVA